MRRLKDLLILVGCLCVLGIGVSFTQFGMRIADLFRSEPSKAMIVSLLESKSVKQLTTRKIVTRSVVHYDNSRWFGPDHTWGVGDVTILVGIDLEQAEVEILPGVEERYAVTLPDPFIQATDLDFDTVYYWRVATGPTRLPNKEGDIAVTLMGDLKSSAHEFVRLRGLMTSRDEIEETVLELLRDFGIEAEVVFLAPGEQALAPGS